MSQTVHAPSQIMGIARDQSYIDTYANQMRLSASLSDVTIVFGVNDDVGPGQTILKDRVAVRFSIGTAKALALNLNEVIEAYEAAVGEIPVPHGITEAIQQMRAGIESNLRQQTRPIQPSNDRNS